jgi:hypothetical protein
VVTPNSFWIREIATLTMLVSRTDMKLPTMSTVSGTTHLWVEAELVGVERGLAAAW